VTFVRFFLEPAGHIGEALNRLLTEAYRDLPFYLWLQVFALIVLLLVVSMFFMSGYRVRGWLWNIEPHRPVEPLRQRIQELEQERQSLHEERQHLQRQLKDEQREHCIRLGELQVYILTACSVWRTTSVFCFTNPRNRSTAHHVGSHRGHTSPRREPLLFRDFLC